MTVRAAALLGGLATLAGCASVPETPPGEIAGAAARYVCVDGTAFTARFDRWGEGAVLTFERFDRDDPDASAQDRGFRVTLTTQRPASGIWYAGSGWSLRGKGDEATLMRPDGRGSACRVGGDAPRNSGTAEI